MHQPVPICKLWWVMLSKFNELPKGACDENELRRDCAGLAGDGISTNGLWRRRWWKHHKPNSHTSDSNKHNHHPSFCDSRQRAEHCTFCNRSLLGWNDSEYHQPSKLVVGEYCCYNYHKYNGYCHRYCGRFYNGHCCVEWHLVIRRQSHSNCRRDYGHQRQPRHTFCSKGASGNLHRNGYLLGWHHWEYFRLGELAIK